MNVPLPPLNEHAKQIRRVNSWGERRDSIPRDAVVAPAILAGFIFKEHPNRVVNAVAISLLLKNRTIGGKPTRKVKVIRVQKGDKGAGAFSDAPVSRGSSPPVDPTRMLEQIHLGILLS